MQVPRGVLLKFSSWWSSPSVWPTSWHMTKFFHAGVLYVLVLKYESFTFTVPLTICSPFIHTWATPSQPLNPYRSLHTSTRPFIALQVRGFVLPGLTIVSRTLETLQLPAVVAR